MICGLTAAWLVCLLWNNIGVNYLYHCNKHSIICCSLLLMTFQCFYLYIVFILLTVIISSFRSRFVLNVPKEDQQSFERILFLVEYAHWFYEDNSVEKNPSLKSLTLKEFTSLCILHHFQFDCFQISELLFGLSVIIIDSLEFDSVFDYMILVLFLDCKYLWGRS